MESSARQARILLVEDSEDDAFFFRWTLQKSAIPHVLAHEADGRTALDYLKGVLAGTHARPDVVFLDLKLPSFSGFDILEWIRQQKWPNPLRVVVLSGSEHASDVARAESLGGVAYLVKPIATEQLRTQIGAAMAPANETAV